MSDDEKKLADVIAAKWTGANDCHAHYKQQREIEERLWSIVTELCSINEYEYPYRVPQLQKRADKLLETLSQPDPPEVA